MLRENFEPIEPTLSKLRFYSAGIVAMNKLLSSKDIEVFPTEELPMADGYISSQISENKAKATDANGNAYETNIKSTVTLKATWLSLTGSNRITAPDVRRGEYVMIYQFGDTDKYYWTTLKEDLRLRKLETVIYAFSATKDESKDATSETTYFFEVSTHKKILHIHTCKADDEPFGYDIQLNTKEGFFIIRDDVGNYVSMDSMNRRLEMKNIDDSHVDINKKDIVISSTDSITLKSKHIVQEAVNHDTTATDLTVKTSNTTIKGSSSIYVESPNTEVN